MFLYSVQRNERQIRPTDFIKVNHLMYLAKGCGTKESRIVQNYSVNDCLGTMCVCWKHRWRNGKNFASTHFQ